MKDTESGQQAQRRTGKGLIVALIVAFGLIVFALNVMDGIGGDRVCRDCSTGERLDFMRACQTRIYEASTLDSRGRPELVCAAN